MKMPRRLNRKQLAEFFSVYRDAFPTWQSDNPFSFFRTSGPVRQLIFVQALQIGEYRIANAVDLLFPIPDWCSIIHEFLSVRYREVSPRQHPSMWPKVLVQIEKEFQPPVREPINLEQIVKLVDDDCRLHGALHPCVGLASLYAFLGNRSSANRWCQFVLELANRSDRGPTEWETRKFEFVTQLQEALASSRELELLDPKGLWR